MRPVNLNKFETVTITNDFHDTEARLRVRTNGRITASQIRRAARKLCPHSECTCGRDVLNRRGQQPKGSPGAFEEYRAADTKRLLYGYFPGMDDNL